MSDLDLVPVAYRQGRRLRALIRRSAIALAALVAVLMTFEGGLLWGIRYERSEVERLRAVQSAAAEQRARVAELREESERLGQLASILAELRRGTPVGDILLAVDRALDRRVWFQSWTFRRAGELVDPPPEAVETGYFIVVPREGEKGGERAWKMSTHMEIRAQATDHAAVARFVRQLVEQPEIEDARVLSTHTRRYTDSEVVDFEVALIVGSRT